MNKNEIENEYFEWLYNMMCKDRFAKSISYRKLLIFLHSKRFTYVIDKDRNRAAYGLDLRKRFSTYSGYEEDYLSSYLEGPCTVLEMMIALSIQCEEWIMDDPRVGDRTSQWFWGMVANLGLAAMTDDNYDKAYVRESIDRFLKREYSPDGKGGLFTVRNPKHDMREVEIWMQLLWYLDSIS